MTLSNFHFFPYPMASLFLLAKWLLIFVLISIFLVISEFLALSQSLLCCLSEAGLWKVGLKKDRGSAESQWADVAHTFSLWGAPSSVTFLSILP